MENESSSPFKIPRHLGWIFLAGIALALLLSDYLLRQRNPFERSGPAGGVPVAVLYFESEPGTPDGIRLAAGLDTLLGPALARAGRDSVISPSVVRAGRVALGFPANGSISPGEALALSGQLGARRILVGSVRSSGGSLAAEARMIAISNGHQLAAVRDTFPVGASPGVVADSLATRLARRQ